jgi:hypothetical protein
MTKYMLLLSALIFFFQKTYSQSIERAVVASAGGEQHSSTMVFEWTLGEPFISTVADSYGIYTEGFHQPILLNTKRAGYIVKASSKKFNIEIAPNPVLSQVRATIRSHNDTRITVVLSSQDGKSILKEEYGSNDTKSIDMGKMTSGIYLLQFYSSSGPIETFKIIKL